MEKFSAEKLLDMGIKLRAWWGDPPFRSGAILKSRLFLLFRVCVEFSAPSEKHKNKYRTKRIQQFFITLEVPTAGCLEFDILKEGYWLYRDFMRDAFSKYVPPVLKFSIQSMSASQYRPEEPVIPGQLSFMPIVKAVLREPTPPDIEMEMIGEW